MKTHVSPSVPLTPAMRAHEMRLGRPLAEVLVEDYGDRDLAQIAADFGVSTKTVMRWLARLGLQRRLVSVHDEDGTPAGVAAQEVAATRAGAQGSGRKSQEDETPNAAP